MPTASTASIMGNSPCFEPYPFVLGKREVLSGEFLMVNKSLVDKLEKLGIWNQDIRNKILSAGGSIQNVEEIPESIKRLYRISREYKQRVLIDHARARAPFICQSQSMNLFWDHDVSFSKLYSALMYAWKQGLKTGSYYMRSRSKMEARLVTNKAVPKKEIPQEGPKQCLLDDPDCEACGA